MTRFRTTLIVQPNWRPSTGVLKEIGDVEQRKACEAVSPEENFPWKISVNQKAMGKADKDRNVKMGPALLFFAENSCGKVVEAKARAA